MAGIGYKNCYENLIVYKEWCCKSSLCRRELIKIIRDSMVKNSLWQPPKKFTKASPPVATRYRPASAGDQHQQCTTVGADQKLAVAAHHETNLCGYDSYLHHDDLCGGRFGEACSPAWRSCRQRWCLHVSCRSRPKEQRLAVTNRTHAHQVKLSTVVLNQQYPNLLAGGRGGRTVRPRMGIVLKLKTI
ncbi:hypothetical protein quinque_002462 [Culex quinquefasciatus]